MQGTAIEIALADLQQKALVNLLGLLSVASLDMLGGFSGLGKIPL